MTASRASIPMLCVMLALAQGGCATVDSSSISPVDAERALPGSMAVVAARFAPKVDFALLDRHKTRAAAEGGATGATAGALLGFSAVLLSCASFPPSCPASAAWVLAPAAAGGAVGAAAASDKAYTKEQLKDARTAIDIAVAELRMQQALHDRVMEYARGHAILVLVPVDGPAPIVPDKFPDYAQLAGREIDTVLELSVLKLVLSPTDGLTGPRMRFAMEGRARLLRVSDGEVVWQRTYTAETPARTPSEWGENNAAIFRSTLDSTYERLAQSIVDELFLTHGALVAWHIQQERRASANTADAASTDESRSSEPEKSGRARQRQGPGYTLLPEYPLPGEWVSTLEPTLRWQAFPRPGDLSALSAPGTPQSKLMNVDYELRLHEARIEDYSYLSRSGVLYTPGPPAYLARGLSEPFHKPGITLKPCTAYLWSVRAKYEFEGRKKATPWAGSYDSYRYPTPPAVTAAALAATPFEVALLAPVLPFLVPVIAMMAVTTPPSANLNLYWYGFETACPTGPKSG